MIKDPKLKEFEIQKVSKISLLLQNLQNWKDLKSLIPIEK